MAEGSGISLSMALGRAIPQPASPRLAAALQGLEVTQADDGPAIFQARFHADRALGEIDDYFLLSSGDLNIGMRALFTVTIGGTAKVVMDGFITHQELVHDRALGASTLVMTGAVVSVMMDLHEISREFPALGDTAIVGAILLPYLALGITPEVIPALGAPVSNPVDQVPQQNDTDRNYIRQLAAGNGYIFNVRPGPSQLMNKAYWGPPPRLGTPQKALTIDMGAATSVEQISFRYDALKPYLFHGYVHEDELGADIPIVIPSSLRLPPLASRTALVDNLPLVRSRQFTDPRPGPLAGALLAQALVNSAADDVVVAEGQLDVLRYGAVLESPGLVAVRGAGQSFDGLYYVRSVTHHIARGSYRQSFTLAREGVGSTISRVAV